MFPAVEPYLRVPHSVLGVCPNQCCLHPMFRGIISQVDSWWVVWSEFAGAECLFPSLDFTNENRNFPLQKLSMQPFPGVFNPWNIFQMCFCWSKDPEISPLDQVCGPHRIHQRGPEVLHRLHRSLAAPRRFLRAKILQWKKPSNKNFQVVLGKNLMLINASSQFLWLQSLFIPIQIHVSLAK